MSKLVNMTIDSVIAYIEERVERDGKDGKDLPLSYIIKILEEVKSA